MAYPSGYATYHLQAFNDKEYVATLKHYKNKGRIIRSVELYKVYNTKLNQEEYLNIKPIGNIDKNYIFYKIEKDLKDSIFIRYLTGSLSLEFEASKEFRDYLLIKKLKNENEFFSEPIPFYRWRSLNWDRINKENKCNQFDRFYILGKLDEDYFKGVSDDELEELIINKKEIKIDTIRDYFQEIQLANERIAFWKVPTFGVIKMKSGKFIKLKYDLKGPLIMDLTNDIKYLNRNKEDLE